MDIRAQSGGARSRFGEQASLACETEPVRRASVLPWLGWATGGTGRPRRSLGDADLHCCMHSVITGLLVDWIVFFSSSRVCNKVTQSGHGVCYKVNSPLCC